MTPLQKAALSCGVKSNPPQVHTTYFPKPAEKIVIIENNSESPYRYSQDLSATLSPILAQNGYLLVQPRIGVKDELIKGAHHLLNLDLPQIHSLISQAELVVSTIPYTTTVARSFGVKNLLLRNTPPDYLEQHFEIYNPCGINEIFEESIIANILSQLNISNPILDREVFYRGSEFCNKTLEIIPSSGFDYSRFQNSGINIRADWGHDEKGILELLNISPSNLVISEEVGEEILDHPNLQQINLEVSDEIKESFISDIKSKKAKLNLFTHWDDMLFYYRLRFIDDIIHLEKRKSLSDLGVDFKEKFCYDSRYKSAKIIFHENKAYPSKAAYSEKLHIQSQDETDFQVIFSEDFYSEIEHFKIYNQK